MTRVEVGELEFTPEEREKKMRDSFEMILQKKPVAVLIVVDLGTDIGTVGVGSMMNLLALASIMPDMVQTLLNKMPKPGHNQ